MYDVPFDFDYEQRKIAESTAIIASCSGNLSFPAQLCIIRESADLHYLSLELLFCPRGARILGTF